MNVSVILGHPDKDSFNHAIAKVVKDFFESRKDHVFFHDLYAEQFNPILPAREIPKTGIVDSKIQKYCDEISQSDVIIIIHPNWWGQPPAILKGWVDRVIRPGIAYEFSENDSGDGIPKGLLKAKFAVIFNTSNTPSKREHEVFSDPLENLWKTCIFDFCGIKNFYRKMFTIVCTSSLDERKNWLNEAKKILENAV